MLRLHFCDVILVSSAGLGPPSLLASLQLPLALLCLYCVLAMLATTGCSLVILSILRCPALRTASNLYLVSLATSDLGLVLIAAPATLTQAC